MNKVWFFLLIVMLSTALILSGCLSQEESSQLNETNDEGEENNENNESPGVEQENGGIVEYKDSPFLADQGLPPVEDRLPAEPKIVNRMPPENLDYEIGRFGGTLRTARTSVDYDAEVTNANMTFLLTTPGILGEEINPSILRDYEVSADEKEFTFYLREGLKWSDGQPVTMEDFEFTINDVILMKKSHLSSPTGYDREVRLKELRFNLRKLMSRALD